MEVNSDVDINDNNLNKNNNNNNNRDIKLLKNDIDSNYVNSDDDDSNSSSLIWSWWKIPEPVLLQIFSYLKPKDILSAGITCKRWHQIALDDFLWKKLLYRDYHINLNIGLKSGADSWKSEYKRLTSNIPLVLTEVLLDHAHQVLHVTFSHNGEMFATCSKDGYVIIWNSSYPCTIKHSHNMKNFSWKYTQYSQFNQSDTLLLVSGVHFGSPHSTSGEIAVFSIENGSSYLRCRVVNRPYDIFGTWFSDQYLISGDLHWLAHLVSTSVLWLNKANQEIDSEHIPIMNQLYKFYNRNASSIRAIMIANCPWLDDTNDPLKDDENKTETLKAAASNNCNDNNENSDNAGDDDNQFKNNDNNPQIAGNPLSHIKLKSVRSNSPENSSSSSSFMDISRNELEYPRQGCVSNNRKGDGVSDSVIHYLDEYHKEYEDLRNVGASIGASSSSSSSSPSLTKGSDHYSSLYHHHIDDDNDDNDDENQIEPAEDDDDNDDFENSIPKYLIFSTGSKTYTPHQIGIKRIRNVNFPKKLDPGPSLRERIAAKKREKEEQNNRPRVEPDWWNYDSVADRFDKVDRIIDLHGHIIGMALSPDHRYLYVNTRPWPKDYIISNPLEPPPIAQEIDVHIIDLITLKRVGNMLRAHKAYTSHAECFFIFLDVCDNYVASGAEDMHAYLWDRYYGICLAKFKHSDVVNSVAFNPKDSEMLVTASDDNSIKVWRSKEKVRKLNIDKIAEATEFRKKNY